MKNVILILALFFIVSKLNANIIYLSPNQGSKYVNVHNNIIIGFDEQIKSSNLSSTIRVSGNLSGNHTGDIVLTSDKKKILFKPHKPFAYNETVEVSINPVKTSSSISNKIIYTFQTQVNKIDWNYKNNLMYESINIPANVNSQRILTDSLPTLTVNVSNNPSPGDLYFTNFPFQAIPNVPHLINADNTGNITYSRELNDRALDYKKQPNGLLTYFSNEHLKFYAEDIQHNLIDSFYCGNGYSTDVHELQVLNNGHALLMSYDPQLVDMSVIVAGGNPNATVMGLIIQEIDENKNVVFQWRSWDYIDITDAVHEDLTAAFVDYIHGNAIELDNDGNLMISSRHISEITKINRSTGDIIWRLGGINNQFTFVNDTLGFSYQHDIRRIANGNITLFDNGNYHSPQFSRAVEYQLDEVNKIATLVWQYRRGTGFYGFAMGSAQRLQNGNTLICWGALSNPFISEVTPSGAVALEISYPLGIFSYRVFRDEVNITLNLKLAIEGFYNTSSNMLSINDTVRTYLRDVSSPYNIIDSAKSIIDSTNFNGNYRFYNASTGNYYISVKHRNGLETWSRTGGESFTTGGVYVYDLTNSSSNAYGSNVIQKGSKYCIYSGDIDQDGAIDISDVTQIDNAAFTFEIGYLTADLNGDYFVDLADALYADNNSFNFVTKITP